MTPNEALGRSVSRLRTLADKVDAGEVVTQADLRRLTTAGHFDMLATATQSLADQLQREVEADNGIVQ